MVTHEDVLMVVTVFGGLGLVANILLGAFVWQAYGKIRWRSSN